MNHRLIYIVVSFILILFSITTYSQEIPTKNEKTSNQKYHYRPVIAFTRGFSEDTPSATVQLFNFFSISRNRNVDLIAFIPQIQKIQGRMPILLLLHGAYDNHTSFLDHSLGILERLSQLYKIIIITPDCDKFGWYINSPLLKNSNIDTYVIDELIPYLKLLFQTDVIGISGLSMGGHGAFILSLKYPGLFKSLSSISGILDITRHKENWELPKVLGRYNANEDQWKKNSAYYLLSKEYLPDQYRERITYLNTLPILISAAQQDRLCIEENEDIHDRLLNLGIGHYYISSPGIHNWEYWQTQLPIHVSFHSYELYKIIYNKNE